MLHVGVELSEVGAEVLGVEGVEERVDRVVDVEEVVEKLHEGVQVRWRGVLRPQVVRSAVVYVCISFRPEFYFAFFIWTMIKFQRIFRAPSGGLSMKIVLVAGA